jgi:hypothetical protein
MEQQPSLPDEILQSIESAVKAADLAANSLPSDAPSGWRPVAYRHVLAAILRDRAVNNTEARITEEDAGYLRAMAVMAADTAVRPGTPEPDATFEVVLDGLLEDWIQNWLGDAEAEDDEDEGMAPGGEVPPPL